MPDRERLRRHLLALMSHVEQLKTNLPVTQDGLRQDPDLRWILERGIYLCIQNLLDSFSHIVSADFNEQWDTYADVAALIQKHNLITKEQEMLLTKMIGVRNRLSHDYMNLDNDVLSKVVNTNLDDFMTFAEIISRYTGLKF